MSKRVKVEKMAAAAGAAAAAAAGPSRPKMKRSKAAAWTAKPFSLGLPRSVPKARQGTLIWGKQSFPPVLRTRFTYSEANNLTVTAGVPSSYVIRMNGPQDPNQTGSGGQPRFYDTLLGATNTAAPYGKYCVTAATLQVYATVVSPTGSGAATLIGITPMSAVGNVPTTLKEMLERAETKTMAVSVYNGGKGLQTLTARAETKNWVGNRNPLTDEDCWGAYNGLPVIQASFGITAAPTDQSSGATINIVWTITYETLLAVANDVADS